MSHLPRALIISRSAGEIKGSTTGLPSARFRGFTRLFLPRSERTVYTVPVLDAADCELGELAMTHLLCSSRSLVVVLALVLLTMPVIATVQLTSGIGTAFAI